MLLPGAHLPVLELPGLSGEYYRLPELSVPCLINFWATWCPPCRAEMTSLNRLADDFGQKGLRLLAISVDEDIYLVREFIRQVPLSFPVLLDPGARLSANDFGIVYYPTTFFVDHHGKIGQIWIGEQNWDAADIRAAIERLLAD